MTDIFYHAPVMADEVMYYLIRREEGDKERIYVDCTLGGGGYTRRILELTDENVKVVALDYDINAIIYSRNLLKNYSARLILCNENFKNLRKVLNENNIDKVNGIVMDLGLSSYQLSDEPGFSYLQDTELDMRADKSLERTAADVLNTYNEKELERIFREYGELRYNKKIARDVVNLRKKKPFRFTGDLKEMMKSHTPGKYLNRELSKLFQSLRIEVNNELENLRSALGDAVTVTKFGARLVVVSYHSLEDRIVKNFFRSAPDMKVITKKPVRPSRHEVETNPRARSAKLRAAERI
ncbi:MAG: 16S rRNA (cytosine(1402)-N(4))-methyltransferase RsmH [Ignavibacteria bacterium]|nr:16S rRNA (cytosine(1402)-N(4))-methyltransferase RsmH [Ignavibacteria bacterium]